jgi:hypothetical protein
MEKIKAKFEIGGLHYEFHSTLCKREGNGEDESEV